MLHPQGLRVQVSELPGSLPGTNADDGCGIRPNPRWEFASEIVHGAAIPQAYASTSEDAIELRFPAA